MNKKWLFISLLILTGISIVVIIILNLNIKYDKLVIGNDNWNSIIQSKTLSNNIIIESIEFNDYNLVIDNENNVIYYSIVDLSNKFNPCVKYITNTKANLVINDNITYDKLEQVDILKIMVYNDKEYRIYSLVVTNYPTLNIIYSDNESQKNKMIVELELFDNHVNSSQRLLKSTGKLKTIEENKEYIFSLTKESIGGNKRENHISIFGMEKRDEYILKKVDNIDYEGKYIRLFINNKYSGLYSINGNGKINIYKRNKENNK